MDEQAARKILLAQAIETTDAQGGLLSEVERDQIDRQARQDAGLAGEERAAVAPEHFIHLRAQRVLAAVQRRSPALAAMQEPATWGAWLSAGTPLAALVLGVLTDVIANPHRVDLVSLPLLGIVAWNLAMYLVLIGGWLLARRGGRRPLLAGLGRWTDGQHALRRRRGSLQPQVAAAFHLRWYRATQSLHVQRCKRVLHLAAAGWAIGVALSLLTRGLVVEYRVGWESTFLSAEQVHAILSLLRLPALLLFPFEPFTVQEIAGLQFSQGGAVAGVRWVYMYVALLLVLVVAPRALLAAFAYARERMLARKVPVDFGEPYFQRLVSLLNSVRVHLGLVTHREEDRAAVLRVLSQDPEAGRTLVRSAHDDVLRMEDLSGAQAPAPQGQASAAGMGWAGRLLGWVAARKPQPEAGGQTLAEARQDCDGVLHVCTCAGDWEAAQPLLQWLGKPVVVLAHGAEMRAAHFPGAAAVLSFDAFARCWVQERVLLDAIGRCLPQDKAAGFGRIAAAWEERNHARLARAMAALAEHLLFAARQVEEVRSSALTVRNLIPAERQAQAQARQGAMDAVVKRLDTSAAEMFTRLRKLHGVEDTAAVALQERMQERFVVQQAIDTPQAGMAGAATGAAMGASVDLLVGGLTLGAATALGALVGGSAAFIAAAWKNRATASGTTVVQLSDEMMQAMVEAALLRYLAVAHYGRVEGEPRPSWKSEVGAAVQAHKGFLLPFWTAARTQPDGGRLAMALARELDTIARKVLAGLYPPA